MVSGLWSNVDFEPKEPERKLLFVVGLDRRLDVVATLLPQSLACVGGF